MRIYKRFAPDRDIVLHHGDCLKLFQDIPSGSIDLTITSPPYCIGKEYEQCRDVDDFIASQKEVLPKIIELTRPGGSICWQVGYHVKDNSITPLDFLIHEIMSSHPGIALRNRIIWTFGHGAHLAKRLSGRHETILWYTKGDHYRFDLDAVRVEQKYPGKRHYKGPNKGEYSGNPLGKNPGDVWDIPNVKAAHVEKTLHPCQFPIALAQRLIRALTPVGGVVLDPYVGSGTTAAACVLEKRKFIGAEIDLDYVEIAKNRIKSAISGDLQFRDISQPIYQPKSTESVVKKPSHFR